MGKIKIIIKKIFGKEELVVPLVEPYNYTENLNSYSGGSLEGKNTLIVISCQNSSELVKEWAQGLESNVVIEKYESNINIESFSSVLVGPFTNIINIIHDEHNADNDRVHDVYNLLQIESNYLIEATNKGCISTAFITDKNENGSAIKSLFKGLSLALGKHGIVENGLIANTSVKILDILNTLSYLNSKYGYILAGEVLKLSEDKRNG